MTMTNLSLEDVYEERLRRLRDRRQPKLEKRQRKQAQKIAVATTAEREATLRKVEMEHQQRLAVVATTDCPLAETEGCGKDGISKGIVCVNCHTANEFIRQFMRRLLVKEQTREPLWPAVLEEILTTQLREAREKEESAIEEMIDHRFTGDLVNAFLEKSAKAITIQDGQQISLEELTDNALADLEAILRIQERLDEEDAAMEAGLSELVEKLAEKIKDEILHDVD